MTAAKRKRAEDVSTSDLISMVQAGTSEEKAETVKRLMRDKPGPDAFTRTPSLEQMREGIEDVRAGRTTKFADFMRDIEAEAAAEGPEAVAELEEMRAGYREMRAEDARDLALATEAIADHEASGEEALDWEDVKKQLDLDDGESAPRVCAAALTEAFKEAVKDAVAGHHQAGRPVHVWDGEAGRIVEVATQTREIGNRGTITAHNVTMSYRYRPADTLVFVIPGPPVPKARARASRSGHHFTPPRTRAYEAMVRSVASASVQRSQWRPPPGSKFVVTIHVFRARKAGDLDNFVKSITDAANGIIWNDDRDIAELHCYLSDDRKSPRVEVSVSVLKLEAAA